MDIVLDRELMVRVAEQLPEDNAFRSFVAKMTNGLERRRQSSTPALILERLLGADSSSLALAVASGRGSSVRNALLDFLLPFGLGSLAVNVAGELLSATREQRSTMLGKEIRDPAVQSSFHAIGQGLNEVEQQSREEDELRQQLATGALTTEEFQRRQLELLEQSNRTLEEIKAEANSLPSWLKPIAIGTLASFLGGYLATQMPDIPMGDPTPPPPITAPYEPNPIAELVVKANLLRIRTSPTTYTDENIIARATSGDLLLVRGSTKDQTWYLVRYVSDDAEKNVEGWVCAQWVEAITYR